MIAVMIDTMGSRIRARRKELGLSARVLSERMRLSESAVRNVENGTNGATVARAVQYSEYLGVTPAWLLFGEEVDLPPAQTPEGVAILLQGLPNGQARLQVNRVMPMPVALQILTLIEGVEK